MTPSLVKKVRRDWTLKNVEIGEHVEHGLREAMSDAKLVVGEPFSADALVAIFAQFDVEQFVTFALVAKRNGAESGAFYAVACIRIGQVSQNASAAIIRRALENKLLLENNCT